MVVMKNGQRYRGETYHRILVYLLAGMVTDLFRQGGDSSDDGAIIQLAGCYQLKISKNITFHFSEGLKCSERGTIAP